MAHGQTTIAQRLSSNDVAAKTSAIVEIRNLPPDLLLIEAMLSLLHDPNPDVAIEAAKTWGGVYEDYNDLMIDVVNKGTSDVRYKNFDRKKLYDLEGDVLSGLSKASRSPSEAVRIEAMRSLCLIHRPAYKMFEFRRLCGLAFRTTTEYKVNQLLSYIRQTNQKELSKLLQDEDLNVVSVAYSALGNTYSEEQLPAITKYLQSGQRDAVAVGFQMLRKAPFNVKFPLLMPWLASKDWQVSLGARVVLNEEQQDLIDFLNTASSGSLSSRKYAIDHLDIANTKAKATLNRLLNDPEPSIRAAALGKIINSQEPKTFAPFTSYLDDPSPEVRGTALEEGARLRAPGILPYLKLGLESSSPALRQSALHAAVHLPESRALTQEIVAASELGVADAGSLIPAFYDRENSHLLARCVTSKSVSSRKLAANYLARSYGEPEMDSLIKLANDADFAVAFPCATRLLNFDQKEAFAALEKLMATSGDVNCAMVLEKLGKSATKLAIPVIESQLKHKHSWVRRKAKECLAGLKRDVGP